MKLTLAEFTILLDTMIGSLKINDGGSYWKFDAETRQTLANILLDRMNNVELEIST